MKNRVVILRSNPMFSDSRVLKEAASLSSHNYDVTLIGWQRNGNNDENYEMEFSGQKYQTILFGIKASFGDGYKNLPAFVKFQWKLFTWLIRNRNEYDIVHACDFDTAYVAKCAGKFTKKKYVFDIFDYRSSSVNNTFDRIVEKMENKAINKSVATIICTEERRKQIQKSTPKRLVIIHNSPPQVWDDKQEETDARCLKTKIAYVGILQDYRLLLEMTEVISETENVELHVGGFGKYESEVKEYSKKNNINFYGELQYSQTIELEKKCDIMTAIYDPSIPNHKYAAPNKFYEALMMGKPLIMVRKTGMSNVVEENEIGVLIEYSKEGFVEGLNNLIKRRDEWELMSRKMKDIYRRDYSWNEMERRLLELYNNII
jgi:glycosyltransferase involved in cell wall biosynthesis